MKAKIRDKEENLIFQIYLSDLLKGLFASWGGQASSRFYDLIDLDPKPVSNEKPEDIIARIKEGIRLKSEV